MSIVGVRRLVDGEIVDEFHAPPAGDFDTLCGVDANDDHPLVGTMGFCKVSKGQKIDCAQCYSIWVAAREVRKSEFLGRFRATV